MTEAPDEPLVKDFYPVAKKILYEHKLGHLVATMDNPGFIVDYLEMVRLRYAHRSLDFSILQWVLDYYRS